MSQLDSYLNAARLWICHIPVNTIPQRQTEINIKPDKVCSNMGLQQFTELNMYQLPVYRGSIWHDLSFAMYMYIDHFIASYLFII